jgi:hypothetical protein
VTNGNASTTIAHHIEQGQEHPSREAVGIGRRQRAIRTYMTILIVSAVASTAPRSPGEFVGQQAEGDGRQPGTEQCDDLRAEQMPEVADRKQTHRVLLTVSTTSAPPTIYPGVFHSG